MKKIIWGLMVLAVIGFGMAACDNGGDDGDAFTGTWKNDDQGIRIVAANGSFTQHMTVEVTEGNSESSEETSDTYVMPYVRGKYTVSGNTVTATIIEVNMREGETGKDDWTAYAQLETEQKQNIPSSITGTISGSTFTVSIEGQSIAFTKVK